MSSISATIGGAARLAPPNSDEEKFFIEKHLENNTFEDTEPLIRHQANAGDNGDTTGRFVAGEEVGVIVVDIKDVRISDWKGTVRDWALISSDSTLANGSEL